MRLTVTINNREALPVRAIPYVSGWNMSPDMVATGLAHIDGSKRLNNMFGYRVVDGSVVAVTPIQWDSVVVALNGLDERLPNSKYGYSEWRNESPKHLPAGVFVWLDEFSAAYSKAFSVANWICDDRKGERELDLVPMVDPGVETFVMDGFNDCIRPGEADVAIADVTHLNQELASMKALTFRHWEEITGVGICSGNLYVVSQKGIYPEQHSDDDLKLLTPEERKILLGIADRDPLIFPCSPTQLLSFVDEDPAKCFEVPDPFREEVKRLGAEQRASEEFGQICGPIDQSTGVAVKTRTRKDGLAIAMDAGFSSYKSKNSANPTARALFDWLSDKDETGNVVDFNANTDKLTWQRSNGGLSDTSFKAFQGRFTAFMKKQD